jgi:hypothetical protein
VTGERSASRSRAGRRPRRPPNWPASILIRPASVRETLPPSRAMSNPIPAPGGDRQQRKQFRAKVGDTGVALADLSVLRQENLLARRQVSDWRLAGLHRPRIARRRRPLRGLAVRCWRRPSGRVRSRRDRSTVRQRPQGSQTRPGPQPRGQLTRFGAPADSISPLKALFAARNRAARQDRSQATA